nr:hypothetical protein Iba_chr13cCG7600 [Ipomoea batatas]
MFPFSNNNDSHGNGILLNSSENKDHHQDLIGAIKATKIDIITRPRSQCAQAVAPDKDAGGSNGRDRGGCEEGQGRQPRHLI